MCIGPKSIDFARERKDRGILIIRINFARRRKILLPPCKNSRKKGDASVDRININNERALHASAKVLSRI